MFRLISFLENVRQRRWRARLSWHGLHNDCKYLFAGAEVRMKWEWNRQISLERRFSNNVAQGDLILDPCQAKDRRSHRWRSKTNQGWIAFVNTHFEQKFGVDVRKRAWTWTYVDKCGWDSWVMRFLIIRSGLVWAVPSQFVPTKWLVATGLSVWYKMIHACGSSEVNCHGAWCLVCLLRPVCNVWTAHMVHYRTWTLQESARKAFANCFQAPSTTT